MHERCAAQDGDRQRLQDHRMRAIMKKRLIRDAPMATLAHALLTALKDHGAHEIFGIPGDFVLPLFKVIEKSNILSGS